MTAHISHVSGMIPELISHVTGTPTSGDISGGGYAVPAVAAPGAGTVRDFQFNLTLPAPTDSRLVVNRIAFRLQAAKTAGASTNVYAVVTVDSTDPTDATHRIIGNPATPAFDVQATAGLVAVDMTAGLQFTLPTDGVAHIYRIWFWTAGGGATLTPIQLWLAAGTQNTGWQLIATLSYSGMVNILVNPARIGSGVGSHLYSPDPAGANAATRYLAIGNGAAGSALGLVAGAVYIFALTTVVTDITSLNYQWFVCAR